MEILKAIATCAGVVGIIVSALVGLFIWLLQKKLDKRDAKKEAADQERIAAEKEREKAREQLYALIVEGIQASIELGTATANAVARIPDAHCNGDMHRALEVAMKAKEKQARFLMTQGIQAIQN